MKGTQRGIALSRAIMWMIVLAFAALFAAKLIPPYMDYFAVDKILKAMADGGDTRGTVKEVRNAFDKRNTIEGVRAVRGDDLEIAKEGGEVVVTAAWQVKVHVVGNMSACLDFSATTAK